MLAFLEMTDKLSGSIKQDEDHIQASRTATRPESCGGLEGDAKVSQS